MPHPDDEQIASGAWELGVHAFCQNESTANPFDPLTHPTSHKCWKAAVTETAEQELSKALEDIAVLIQDLKLGLAFGHMLEAVTTAARWNVSFSPSHAQKLEKMTAVARSLWPSSVFGN